MLSLHILVVTLCLMLLSLRGQQENPPPPGSTTLTRENVEALFQVLSSVCRTELESALGAQAEISIECKEEIQSAMVSLNIPFGQQPPPADTPNLQQMDEEQMFDQPPPKRSRAKQERKPQDGVIYYVIGFVALFFAVVGGYIAYVNSIRGEVVVKQKKLSKKKEEKLRQKGGVKI